jgi:hypothetical protein
MPSPTRVSVRTKVAFRLGQRFLRALRQVLRSESAMMSIFQPDLLPMRRGNEGTQPQLALIIEETSIAMLWPPILFRNRKREVMTLNDCLQSLPISRLGYLWIIAQAQPFIKTFNCSTTPSELSPFCGYGAPSVNKIRTALGRFLSTFI